MATAAKCLCAFLMCFVLAVSFSMSWCDRIGSAIGKPTICPGPSVQGPPVKSITRAPVLGTDVSSSATAAEMAAPVQRFARLAGSIGHGSMRRSASTCGRSERREKRSDEEPFGMEPSLL